MRWRLILIVLFSLASALLLNWPESWRPLLDEYYGGYVYPTVQQLLSSLPTPRGFALADTLWLAIPLLLLLRLLFMAGRQCRIAHSPNDPGVWPLGLCRTAAVYAALGCQLSEADTEAEPVRTGLRQNIS